MFMENLTAEIVTQSNYLEKDGIEAFFSICCKVLKKYAPQKQQHLRSNHKLFINVEISKLISETHKWWKQTLISETKK